MNSTEKYNKDLIEKYPFLDPRRWGTVNPAEYLYDYTELDDMPTGWRVAFGEQLCEEIKEELIRVNYLDEYRVLEIKEKYGTLRWYDCGTPTGCKVREILKKYEELSFQTCIECGAPATQISRGWIAPFCDTCAPKQLMPCSPIQDYIALRKELNNA